MNDIPPVVQVALIEDQTSVREMVAHMLAQEPGYEVVLQSGDGQSAVEACLELKPDLVLLDLMLPGLNGAEVLRRFSRHLQKTRVLVFSGYRNPTLIRELLKAGAHGFVEKTASLADLQEGIATVARGGNYYSPEIARLLRDAVAMPGGRGGASLDNLTTRERETLQLIAESNSTKEIAARLKISVKTAENHRTNLMKKLDLHDVASLTRYAIENGLVEAHSWHHEHPIDESSR